MAFILAPTNGCKKPCHESQVIETMKALRALHHVGKHLIATGVFAVVGMLVSIVAYFVLFVVAVVTNQELGGPLTIVFLPVVAFLIALVIAAFCFYPATAIAEWLCAKKKWNLFAQIPISSSLLFLEMIFIVIFSPFENGNDFSTAKTIESAFIGFLLLAIPLGFYWWTLKSIDGVRIFLSTLVYLLRKTVFGFPTK